MEMKVLALTPVFYAISHSVKSVTEYVADSNDICHSDTMKVKERTNGKEFRLSQNFY